MKRILIAASLLVLTIVISAASSFAQDKKTNIVVIRGDDIGMWNVGIYTHGMMGSTPNIDVIEGGYTTH
jgi:arylsulfatase